MSMSRPFLKKFLSGAINYEKNPVVISELRNLNRNMDCCLDLRTTAAKKKVFNSLTKISSLEEKQSCKVCEITSYAQKDLLDIPNWKKSIFKLRDKKELDGY